ncbi:MAG TPA: OprD family outer membrane porin [Sulfurimonas sp.]|uniref:OprD family outer membrane porin n=1 Tax=Sulfurimonas sp. TaxID=2022749 RepID=UPI002B72EDD2|nr:OprD family outer membrane porin [Sulfurimonas sp.]HUH42195.1 OprD family outer membrane porin [Sulfurimonas sp.]
MSKQIGLSVLVASMVLISSLNGADDINTMFSEGKVSGQARMFYIDREYQGSAGTRTHRGSTAIGGYIKYETAELEGFNLGAAFYTTNKVDSRNTIDQTLLGEDNDNYTILGEAYLQYKHGNTSFKGGRQKLSTPMLGDDDARMIPNLFEAYVLTNKDIANTTLTLGHVTKFAQGTFGRVYSATPTATNANKLLSAISGYSYVDSLNQTGEFKNVGDYAFGNSTDGITMASITYTGIQNLKLTLWDYYAHDIMNIVYGEADISWSCLITDAIKPYAGVQVIKEDSVGDEVGGDINSRYAAAKLGFKVENFDLSFAYSKTGDNDSAEAAAGGVANAIISPWGGTPAYTQGMVTRHAFMAGTAASKVTASYNFKDTGANLITSAYYAEFDMDKNSGYGLERTASEAGFDAIYNLQEIKNLQLRLRGNFPRGYAANSSGKTGWNEYRFIVNYNF